MDDFAGSRSPAARRDSLLASVAELSLRKRLRTDADIVESIERLRDVGGLLAPLPERYGGLGMGCSSEGAKALSVLLQQIGGWSLSLGRLFEGHVNALQLITLYGEDDQILAVAQDAARGDLFAIWNTEPPPGVRMRSDGRLQGAKTHCSAAGLAAKGLITVDQHEGGRLLIAELGGGERIRPAQGSLHGMQQTLRGEVDFNGYRPEGRQWIGEVGDYLREPAFSAGAWRTLAVIAGGMNALIGHVSAQLKDRARDGDHHQRGRLARLLINQETAVLWVNKCSALAEGSDYAANGLVAYVALARSVVETACLEAIQLAQRSIGLSAFIDSNPIEGLMRDLATYLRQPALDEALGEAVGYFIDHPLLPSGGLESVR